MEYDADALINAHSAAGMTCCGKSMKLERFLNCMDEKTAQGYALVWLSMTTVAPDQVFICGWPDCRQVIPNGRYSVCYMGAGRTPTFYCPNCKANSQLGSHYTILVPAR